MGITIIYGKNNLFFFIGSYPVSITFLWIGLPNIAGHTDINLPPDPGLHINQ